MNRLQKIKLAALGATLVLPIATASIDVAAEEITVKLWARADRSGPLRAGNIVAAAEPLNAALKAAGSDKTVKVEVFEGPATGYRRATRSTSSRPSRSTRGRTSMSPRMNGSASSPSPATRWTLRTSSRRTRGPLAT